MKLADCLVFNGKVMFFGENFLIFKCDRKMIVFQKEGKKKLCYSFDYELNEQVEG